MSRKRMHEGGKYLWHWGFTFSLLYVSFRGGCRINSALISAEKISMWLSSISVQQYS